MSIKIQKGIEQLGCLHVILNIVILVILGIFTYNRIQPNNFWQAFKWLITWWILNIAAWFILERVILFFNGFRD